MAELPDTTGSPAPIEERIGALLDGGAASEESEGPTEEDAQGYNDDTEDDAGQSDPDLIEEEIEGVTVRGRKDAVEKLKSERASKQDYTAKTQEAANIRRAAEDRMQFIETRERVMGEVMQDVAALNAKRERLQQLGSLDVTGLDPSQIFQVQRQIDSIKEDIGKTERALQGKAQAVQAMVEKHRGTQWQLAVEGVKQAVGNVSQADDAAMLETVKALGFDENELRGRFADARFLRLVYEAAKYRTVQSAKPGALQAANKAPPVVKPGTSGPNPFSQKMQFAKAMKSAKSDGQKAELIGAKLMNRFKF